MDPSGCTPKKKRRRSMRNLRRQSACMGGEDLDSSLMPGASALQDPPVDLDALYGSLWMELDIPEPKSRVKSSKRKGRRSSFGITPYQQPEAVRFSQNREGASPVKSPPIFVENEYPGRSTTTDEDPRDTSLNMAFSLFNIHSSEDQDLCSALQGTEESKESELPLCTSPHTEWGKAAESYSLSSAHLDMPSPVAGDDGLDLGDSTRLESPEVSLSADISIPVSKEEEADIESEKTPSPESSALSVPSCSDPDTSLSRKWCSQSDAEETGSPNDSISLLSSLSYYPSQEIPSLLSMESFNSPPSPGSKKEQERSHSPQEFQSPASSSTSPSSETESNTTPEHAETNSCGNLFVLSDGNKGEADESINLSCMDTEENSAAEQSSAADGKTNIDFDLIFESPAPKSLGAGFHLRESKEPFSPLALTQPGDRGSDTCGKPSLGTESTAPSDVDMVCYPASSSELEEGTSASFSLDPSDPLELVPRRLEDTNAGGAARDLAVSRMKSDAEKKPKLLRRSHRYLDLMHVPDTIDGETLCDGGFEDASMQKDTARSQTEQRGSQCGKRSDCLTSDEAERDGETKSGMAAVETECSRDDLPSFGVVSPKDSFLPMILERWKSQRRKKRSADFGPLLEERNDVPSQNAVMPDEEQRDVCSVEAGLDDDSAPDTITELPTRKEKTYQKRRKSADVALLPEKMKTEPNTDATLSETQSLGAALGSVEEGNDTTTAPYVTKRRQYQKRKRRSNDRLLMMESIGEENSDLTLELANMNERKARRLRRRSFDFSQNFPRQESTKADEASDAMDEDPSDDLAIPAKTSEKRRKPKELSEEEVEDLYRNKNYKLPEVRTWETIFESPEHQGESSGATLSVMGKRRYKRVILFDEKDASKLRKRKKKAIQKGWPAYRRPKVTEDDVRRKLDLLEASLNRSEDIW